MLAIGVFDGVHIAHQRLLKKVVHRAEELGVASVVMTFDPHPLRFIDGKREPKLLIPLYQRLCILESMNIQMCIVVPFTKRISSVPAVRFIDEYIADRVSPCEVWVGENFRF